MGVILTKSFKSGNSVAVRLPAELGIAAGTPLCIEQVGDKLTIVRSTDAARIRQDMQALAEEIRQAWESAPYHEIEEREPIEFPERPGL